MAWTYSLTIIQISTKYNFRTQSSIVQVIRIVPKEGTIERNHKSITKVTLSEDDPNSDSSNVHQDLKCVSKRRDFTNKLSSDSILNERKFNLMKSTIKKIINDKESALKENTALKMYKHNVHNLRKENARLTKEIKKLQRMHKVESDSDDDIRYSPDGTDTDNEADLDGVRIRVCIPTEKVGPEVLVEGSVR